MEPKTDPERLGRKLTLLYDGAVVAAQMDADPSAAKAAREVVASLLEASLARG